MHGVGTHSSSHSASTGVETVYEGSCAFSNQLARAQSKVCQPFFIFLSIILWLSLTSYLSIGFLSQYFAPTEAIMKPLVKTFGANVTSKVRDIKT